MIQPIRTILVSVGYHDLLAATLPLNSRHWSEVMVVTDLADDRSAAVAEANEARVFRTDAFTRGGAEFNKWLALEEGLDAFGRHGVLCIADADVIWPIVAPIVLPPGCLLTPYRRMAPWPLDRIPPEEEWSKLPRHRNVNEWAGYSQVFAADDPALGPPPWHQTDWKHAGGADTVFQRKWPANKKVRPPWEVLHLGEAGANWYGRATPLADGTVPPDADAKREKVRRLWAGRRAFPVGTPEAVRWVAERLG